MEINLFIEKLNKQLTGVEVNHVKFGKGTITKIVRETIDILNNLDFLTKINFENEQDGSHIVLFSAIKKGILSIKYDMTELFADFNVVCQEFEAAQKAADLARQKKYDEAKKKEQDEAKAKKAEVARLARIQKAQADARALSGHILVLTNDLYGSLGWLAKNIGAVSAQVPDFLENWFTGNFPNQPYTLYDSTAKTSGGYSMKWGLSLTASIKKSAGPVPNYIKRYLNEQGTKITSTQFIFDLVKKFGFVFGKEQNIDSILEEIPNDKLDFFKEGLAA